MRHDHVRVAQVVGAHERRVARTGRERARVHGVGNRGSAHEAERLQARHQVARDGDHAIGGAQPVENGAPLAGRIGAVEQAPQRRALDEDDAGNGEAMRESRDVRGERLAPGDHQIDAAGLQQRDEMACDAVPLLIAEAIGGRMIRRALEAGDEVPQHAEPAAGERIALGERRRRDRRDRHDVVPAARQPVDQVAAEHRAATGVGDQRTGVDDPHRALAFDSASMSAPLAQLCYGFEPGRAQQFPGCCRGRYVGLLTARTPSATPRQGYLGVFPWRPWRFSSCSIPHSN